MAPVTLTLVPPSAAPTAGQAFHDHARYVAGVVTRLLGRDDEVQDVVQETFLVALKRLEQLREPDALRGWLAMVAVRIASRRLRQRRLRSFFGLDEVTEVPLAAEASPDDRILLRRIYARLDRLPVAERVAWSLRHLEGEQLETVAKLCRCSLATAKRRIAAAHAVLEVELADG